MQYILLIYSNEQHTAYSSPEERHASIAEWFDYTEALKKAGVYVGGDALQPVAMATSVRVREGERMITDGPFAETKEQLGGYYIIEAEDLDEAIEWAVKCPASRFGTLEVRPIAVFDT